MAEPFWRGYRSSRHFRGCRNGGCSCRSHCRKVKIRNQQSIRSENGTPFKAGRGESQGTESGSSAESSPSSAIPESDSQPQPPPQAAKKRSYFTPASASTSAEWSFQDEKTGEFGNQRSAKSSRPGIRSGGGGTQIVEVQGGHIVRSIGRKDRHSKVCTAKGPRDRRVRLSAHTAIQFYDVQDRLGYDRPSKAVDWLIKKAKSAIDKLGVLPAWNPNVLDMSTDKSATQNSENAIPIGIHPLEGSTNRASNRRGNLVAGDGGVSECSMQNLQNTSTEDNPNSDNSSFLPPSFDSDSIADTIKSFLPTTTTGAAETPSSIFEFDAFPPDLLSRTSSRTQDLRLSLQSLQGRQERPQHPITQGHQNDHPLFSGTTLLGGFDLASAGWSEHHAQSATEISRLQRILYRNTASADDSGGGAGAVNGEYVCNSQLTSSLPPPSPILQPLFGENELFSQRGPLQSSYTPSIRAWIDPSIAFADNQQHQIPPTIYHQPSFPGLGFASGGFSRFLIPARFPGEEEHDGISEKPSSASSTSRH